MDYNKRFLNYEIKDKAFRTLFNDDNEICRTICYILYKGIDKDNGLLYIINSYDEEKSTIKKYSPFLKAESEFEQFMLKPIENEDVLISGIINGIDYEV